MIARSASLALVSAVFVAGCSIASAAAADDMKIEVVGLQVSKPLPIKEKKDNRFQMQTDSMFGSPGTHIHFFVTDPQRDVLDVEEKGSKATCTDDKGKDLATATKDENPHFFPTGSPFSAREAKDNGGTIIELEFPNTPAKGASKVIVKGEVALRCGIGEIVVDKKDVALKPKTAVKAGPVEFTINSAEDQDFGDVKFMIELKASQPFDAIREIEFLDADGKTIEHENMGSSSFGFGGKMEYQRNIGLHKKVDKCTLRIKHYKTIETVKVPLDLEVGVGF
ncbi:MAG: hypothetical protein WD875_01680 [Pirellulales bacterium]